MAANFGLPSFSLYNSLPAPVTLKSISSPGDEKRGDPAPVPPGSVVVVPSVHQPQPPSSDYNPDAFDGVPDINGVTTMSFGADDELGFDGVPAFNAPPPLHARPETKVQPSYEPPDSRTARRTKRTMDEIILGAPAGSLSEPAFKQQQQQQSHKQVPFESKSLPIVAPIGSDYRNSRELMEKIGGFMSLGSAAGLMTDMKGIPPEFKELWDDEWNVADGESDLFVDWVLQSTPVLKIQSAISSVLSDFKTQRKYRKSSIQYEHLYRLIRNKSHMTKFAQFVALHASKASLIQTSQYHSTAAVTTAEGAMADCAAYFCDYIMRI